MEYNSFQPAFSQNDSFGSQAQKFDTYNSGGGFTASQASPAGGTVKKQRDPQSLTPVTIRQLLEAEQKDSKFRVDNRDLAQITLVAQILNIEVNPTNINYMLDDGTGKTNVRVYVDGEDDDSKRADVREHMYVRVIGNMRPFNDVRGVVGFQIIPVRDMDEITYHFLQVISTHLLNTKGKPNGVKTEGGGAAPIASTDGSIINANGYAGDSGGGNFTEIQSKVLKIFNRESGESDAGISTNDVFQKLPDVPQQKIMEVIGFLSDEGHLYSTIDEDHFKSTHVE